MPAILKSPNLKLTLLLVLYLVLATTYSIVVPIGRGADEWAHYWYAQFIAQNGRLPTTSAERETAGYKSDWPPLYHLAAAGLTAWIETDGPPDFKYRADNIRRQLVPAQGSEAILHTQDELFPWQQEILVWHLGRFLSIVFSAATLVLTYFISLEFFAGKKNTNAPYTLREIPPENIALISVAFLVFNPRFLFTGMLFNYDGLTLLLASLFLWTGIRVAKGYHSHWGFWLLGVLAGLALVTKYLTILLPLEILVIAIFLKRKNTHHAPRNSQSSILRYLGQAALAYLFIVSLWFGYLIINFNEVDTYGPVLGALAPLIRGDGSDRTVEEIFAWMSGGQAPPLAYIERQSYTARQIIIELPTTFWGNPIERPYPLNGFIGAMSLLTALSALGLALFWWGVKGNRFWLNLLLLHCALPLPFMLVRLFGARDVLEAVQGRHILFLAAPAVAVLFILGWWSASRVLANILRVFPFLLYAAPYMLPVSFYVLLGLMATGAVAQLLFMADTYAAPLPVKTMPHITAATSVPDIKLNGGATLIDYQLDQLDQSLQITLIWQGGNDFAPEDYQTELQLVDDVGQPAISWQGYQTQARYPTRAWQLGDTIYDTGWLPLTNLPAGYYELQLRILGKDGPVADWQTLTEYEIDGGGQKAEVLSEEWTLWREGQPYQVPVVFSERETAQFTIHNSQSIIHNYQLVGPDDTPHDPVSGGPGWANFIVQPDWPAGNYRLSGATAGQLVLRVSRSERNFQTPQVSYPLNVNFEGQVKLLGYDLPARRVEPGDGLPITLYWQGLQWMGEDFVIFNRLLDNQQIAFGGYDRLPKEDYSTLLWAPGQVVVDGFVVPVDSGAPNEVYTLDLGLYRKVNGEAESLQIIHPETGEATGVTSVTIGPIKVGGPPPGVTVETPQPQVKVVKELGTKVNLLGFDLPNQRGLESAVPFEIVLYWQALEKMDANYTVFVHIRNEIGEIVSQKDFSPAGGMYPTSLWEIGETIKDNAVIPLGHLGPGRYEVAVGLYDLTTGARLPIDGSPDNAVVLQEFNLK